MRNLYIDFDGVIMNTIDITYNDMIKKGINQDSQEEVRNYYANLNWSKLLEEAEIINDGINAINNIIGGAS